MRRSISCSVNDFWQKQSWCKVCTFVNFCFCVFSIFSSRNWYMCLQLGIRKVRTKARIVEGDAGKVICREADRLKPAAVILGTRGRGLIQRYPTLKLQTLYISVAHLDIQPFWISFIAYGLLDLALYPANFASRKFLIIWSHNTATIPSKMKFRILHVIIKVVL